MYVSKQILARTIMALALFASAPALMALEKQTIPFWEIVSCPNEEVYIEGSYRVQAHFVEGADHSTSVFQVFWKGSGFGLESDSEYSLRGKWMEVIQENPPFIFLWNDHFQLIGKGTAPNYRFYFKVKFVVNANGEVIIDLISDETPCEYVDGG